MALKFTIDQTAISLVVDGSNKRVLATAFSFIKPNWAVTAKHVVIQHGLVRERIMVAPHRKASVPARMLYAHPQVDLAVLELDRDAYPLPLFPGHHALSRSTGLICAGYSPNKSKRGVESVVFVNQIPSFQLELRERSGLIEEVILFDAAWSEGGYSGGPVFGQGGGVVAVVIDNFPPDKPERARATSIAPLVERLSFCNSELRCEHDA